MIIYDLKCENGHKFEGWFRDRKAFEEQKAQMLIACPVCGSSNSELLPSFPRIMSREGENASGKDAREISPLKLLHKIQKYVSKNFEDVGERFAETALNIHHGKEDPRNIKGTTTQQEEDVLKEEGIPFFKIPLPKLDS